MSDVLLSLDDETEKMLRELAMEKYGGKKGALTEAASKAISSLYSASMHRQRKAALRRLIDVMEKGIDLGLKGKKPYESRDELYADRLKGFD